MSAHYSVSIICFFSISRLPCPQLPILPSLSVDNINFCFPWKIKSKIIIALLFYMFLPHLKMYLYPLSSFLPSCRTGEMFLFLPEVSRSMCVLIATCFFVDLALLHFLYFETLISFSCFPSIWMWTSLFSKPNQSEHLPPPIYTHCF